MTDCVKAFCARMSTVGANVLNVQNHSRIRDVAGTLSSNTFRMAVMAFERSGFDANPLLEKCEISRKTIDQIWSRIPIEKEKAFWRLAAEVAQNNQIGLLLGKQVPFGTFPLLDYVGASCSSLLQCLHLLTKYSKIVYGEWNPELDENSHQTDFRLGVEGDPEDCRHTTEFTFTVLCDRLREFSGIDIPLLEIHFRHTLQADIASYQKIFGGRVYFDGSEDICVFPSQLDRIACKNANPLALGSLIHGVDSLLGKLVDDQSSSGKELIESIQAEIKLQISDGEISADLIASRLGLSKRTLQRKLEKEGRSLRALINEVRRDVATTLLRTSEDSIEQIALQLGYSDLKAFSRAFAEWYKMSPTEYRRSLRG